MNNLEESEKEKEKMILEFKKKEKNYFKEKNENLKLMSDKNIRISELENKIKIINSSLNNSNKKIDNYERIIIKQEDLLEK